MSNVQEAQLLAQHCLELVVDLLPDGERMPTPRDARETGVQLLQNIRAIQNELALSINTDGSP